MFSWKSARIHLEQSRLRTFPDAYWMYVDMEISVVDPVCGTKLNPDIVTYKYQYLGRTFYFCCLECTIAFDEEPEKYKGNIGADVTFEKGE